jgi:hypothetical protein
LENTRAKVSLSLSKYYHALKIYTTTIINGDYPVFKALSCLLTSWDLKATYLATILSSGPRDLEAGSSAPTMTR